MFNPVEVESFAFVRRLQRAYHRNYGRSHAEVADILAWAATMALENIANSDALYHNVEHTILVTLVGQEILRGKHIREGGVSSEDWLHVTIALLCHDIGYVRGVCRADRDGCVANGRDATPVALPPGATDAFLSPYHVDRGKLFVQERFGGHPRIQVERLKEYIEPTRFPVPLREDPPEVSGLASVVRAADLVGQLSDPRYLLRIPALFAEFKETGVAEQLGFRHAGELRANYPSFYWKSVHPYIWRELEYLALTQQGKQVRANLFANVFTVEHEGRPSAARA
ncbi:MAG TPA: metal-dependent phosphohydrolase [Vicinamibacteria bacterium]|nr:metal-dependent phosphohydrolase [Vicinamibacteria bacterium]